MLFGGWGLGIEPLTRIRPSFVAMVPSTAACFMLTGAALLLILAGGTIPRRTALLLIAAAMPIALTNLALSLLGRAGSVEELVFQAWEARDGMAVGTEFSFLAALSCLSMMAEPRSWSARACTIVATGGLLIASMASIGYLFDTSGLYSILIFDAMALHTSLGMLMLFLALLLAQPSVGWMGTLLDRGSGSRRARRIFPIVLAAPLLFCLAALEMTRADLFSENMRLAMLSIAMMFLSAIIALQSARRQNEVEHLARHDPLTGLPNRALFYEALEAALNSVGGGSKVGLIIIDLDHFKQINDTMGHHAGDAVLRAVGGRLKNVLRPEDMAARLGGDEFAAILVGRETLSEIAEDADAIHAALGEDVEIDRQHLRPSLSLGVAVFSKRVLNSQQLMRKADMALYESKANGRNGVRICDTSAIEVRELPAADG